MYAITRRSFKVMSLNHNSHHTMSSQIYSTLRSITVFAHNIDILYNLW